MQQITDWLKKLSMSEYRERFVENDVDISVLPYLTDQDLKDLGVSLGHRRKMLAAIAELPGGAIPTSVQPVVTEPIAQDTAERRQITVMFSDLVGSTALSVRMDPEDLREVISVYQKCAAEIVHRFGGFVAQYLGDGVLVYFRLSAGPQGRCRARGPSGVGADRGSGRAYRHVLRCKLVSGLQLGWSWSVICLGQAMRGSAASVERCRIWQRDCRRWSSRARW